MRLAGVVVLYNSDNSIIENINSYLKEVEILFVIDNSEIINDGIINKIKQLGEKIIYISLGSNYGIAKALNIGAEEAIKRGYDWLLTMDQDSKFPNLMLRKLMDFLEVNMDKFYEKAGIVSPDHITKKGGGSKYKEGYKEELSIMTSGNILNLNVYEVVGEFNEKLFIDRVDHEYGLRLNLNKFKVIRYYGAKLEHNLGNIERKYLFNKVFFPKHHNAIRKYYITRNALFIVKNYKKQFPRYCRKQKKSIRKMIRNIILYENNKIKKLRMVGKGYIDFIKNKYGKYE